MENYRFERVKRLTEELWDHSLVQSFSILSWKFKRGFFLTPEEVDQSKTVWEDFDIRTNVWSGPEEYCWFRTSFEIPKSFAHKPLWFSISTKSVFQNSVNPQYLLFINGDMVQGMDMTHREARLFEKARAGERVVVDLQAYIGSNAHAHSGVSEHIGLITRIVELDPDILQSYYDLSVPNRVVAGLPEYDDERIQLQLALNKAVDLLDLRVPYSREFYDSLHECGRLLKNEVYKKLGGNSSVLVACIGENGSVFSDTAWKWTAEQTCENAVRSFATVLKLMEEYPNYHYHSGCPQFYRFVKENYPGMFERICRRIKEGRWEVEGICLAGDGSPVSGESLIRQLQYGKKFFKNEFGVNCSVLFPSEFFGYSASFPQVMKQAGIRFLITEKTDVNSKDSYAPDTFWWKGIDGTEILTHRVVGRDGMQAGDKRSDTSGGLEPDFVLQVWQDYQNKEINNNILLPYGSDGGPTRGMLETGERLEYGLAGTPRTRMGTVKAYFEELQEQMSSHPNPPRRMGEISPQNRRGIRASANGWRCEARWNELTFFNVLASLAGVPYDARNIDSGWERLLLNRFRAALPSSSVKELYEIIRTEYDELESSAQEQIQSRMSAVASTVRGKSNDLVLFNSLSFERRDPVVLETGDYTGVSAFIDEAGNRLPVQHTADNQIVFCPSGIPPVGFAVLTPDFAREEKKSLISLRGNELDTPFYHVVLNRAGQLDALFDKEAGREILKSGQKGNVLRVYEDYGNWDAVPGACKSWTLDKVAKAEWLEQGAVRWVLRTEHEFLESVIVQKIIFYTNSRRIDFQTSVDWKYRPLLLKAEFAVDVNACEVTGDIPFGSVRRSMASPAVWGRTWLDLSEGDYGVSLLNDYGHGYGIADGRMSLNLTCTNSAVEREEYRFTYSLLPHLGDCGHCDVRREAAALSAPMRGVSLVSPPSGSFPAAGLFSLNAENVVVETVKRAEDGHGIILRMYEDRNRRTEATLTWHREFAAAVECDLLENEIVKPFAGGKELKLSFRPFELKTVRILD